MPEPSLFRQYQIVQDADGSNVELIRDANQVAVLAFDTLTQEFVHCHVLLEPLADRAAFEEACRRLQARGHPLLAPLKEAGEDEGNPFYITGNVDGETLGAYLARQQEIPGWLAVMVACRALETVIALMERSDLLPDNILNGLRVVQTGSQQLQIQLSDYRLLAAGETRNQGLKQTFDKPAKMLRAFFQDQSGGGPTLPDQLLPGTDFMELLAACLLAADRSSVTSLRELKTALQKLAPEQLTGEIPTAHKPRALLAPLLASYQEVARGVVNLIRIQSQRLDMSNPYSMRGTLTKTGRTVLVEQMLPERLAGPSVRTLAEKGMSLSKKREFPDVIPLVLLHEGEEITCIAEEMAEGVSLADLLRERRSLNVHEAYLVLAGLDGALDSLEKSGLEAQRLRLEDIFLLTGFPREDARTARLMLTKLNEWPAFSLLLRGHPTLAAMAGRGLNPAVLLPQINSAKPTVWNGAWLSAVGRFLVGLEAVPGQHTETPGGTRDRESIARLFDEEIQRYKEEKACPRADFLARYARILQHHELVKPSPAPASEPLVPAAAKAPSRMRTISAESAADKNAPFTNPPMALTSGGAPISEKPTIGFAELLFRDTSVMERGTTHDWAKTAADAPPTIHPNEVLLAPEEFVPFWLRAAVFIGGSIVAGAVLAHLSGDAFWLKSPVIKAIPVQSGTPVSSVPSASAPLTPEPPRGPAAPQVTEPALPPETAPPPSGGLLQPPASTLKDNL
ncbi:hypothetical protein EI77_02491 [Prosthecobacter fusiformis]|uniref:Protein kinase domain-containing protein n=1 Tax=Prosthecobacter fusiformis TaxID=48464 RepID=A0A4R7S2X0_9BACT|nr:hypothetical protein [Prosthecobacter fusiformis]TDU71367.1 hypothetical protein EI77_02491 [Prosthecobacter fusiformis]